ncbi:MAG: gluconate 2-dehydrogenase subunit 3 family protein [Acidobacteriia bacterium]|nr:gluconate 2-dehydrogenase subunit 3 family protein [Terriglobia bacterium]
MKRREFLTLPGSSLGGVLLYTLAGEPVRMQAQTGEIKVPLRFFTSAEARVVQAACDRIFPSDASGPGATEAGVVIYIDRQLAGPYGRDKYRYTKPPFVESVPEHGYQGKAAPREIYREGIQKLGDFASLAPAARDEKLRGIETSTFFRLLRQHTIEGMFSDPLHGGNAGMIGWQLIGYPGPRMSYREEIDKAPGQAYRQKPASLAQIVGHPVTGWEDEKG